MEPSCALESLGLCVLPPSTTLWWGWVKLRPRVQGGLGPTVALPSSQHPPPPLAEGKVSLPCLSLADQISKCRPGL